MNILLIGGTGVLSSAVTAEAQKKGIKVTMINRGNGKIPEGVEFIKATNTNIPYIKEQIKDRCFDAVIDFLCYTKEQLIDSYKLYSNYTKQYIFISTCEVYDKITAGSTLNEDSPKDIKIWDYSSNKWVCEQALVEMAKIENVKYTIVRPSITYGYTRIPYGISPQYGYHWTLAARILAGKPIIRWNKGENCCNMTRVEDFAVGVVGLIGNSNAYNEAFNVCGDETPTFKEVLDAMSDYLGKQAVTIDIENEFYGNEIANRKGELLGGRCIDAINSNAKVKDVVPEFKQTIFIKEGVKMTLDSYKARNYQKGIDWDFDADTDRIITKWCKKKGIDASQYNLHFIDYLDNASCADKRKYWEIFNKENPFVKVLIMGERLITKILRKVRG